VFLGGGFSLEGAKVSAFSRLRIFLSRIQTVTGFDFPDHNFFVMSTEVETSLDISGLHNSETMRDFSTSLEMTTNHGDALVVAAGEGVGVVDVAQAPRCFSRATLSRSSNRSM
jgi:hypothetical protein